MSGHDSASHFFLSSSPPTAIERRFAFFLIVVTAAICLTAIPFAKVQLTPLPVFMAVYQSILIVSDIVTAVLLFSNAAVLRSRSLMILAGGYLFAGTIAAFHMATFPGLFTPGGLLGAGPQSTAWLYMFWHGGFALAVIGYYQVDGAMMRRPSLRQIVTTALIVLSTTIGLVILATDGAALLPAIMVGNNYATIMVYVVGSVWGMILLALGLAWRHRARSVLDLWLCVAMGAWLFDVALAALLNAGRFDVGFYVGRFSGLLASNIVLLGLLIRTNGLYAKLVSSRSELAEQNAMYLDTVQAIVVVLDRAGCIQRLNRAGCQLLGYAEDELLGKNWFETCLPQPAGMATVFPVFQKIMDGDLPSATYFKNQVRCRNGELRLIAWRNAYTVDSDGKTTGTLSAGEDVTDRKQMQEDLAVSEARYRSLFDNNMDAILLTTPDGGILAANPEAQRIFGGTEDDLRRLGRAGVVDSTDPHLAQALEERQSTGRTRTELSLVRVDGTRFPAEVSSQIFLAEDGQVLSTMAIRDISTRKQSEERLRELSQAVEQSPESILITDLDARIKYVNESFIRTTGYTRDEILGKNPKFLQSGKTPAATYESLWATVSQGGTWQGEMYNRRKDGSEYVQWAIITPLRQPDGTVSEYVAVQDDITERKRQSEELNRHRHHLEQLVEERTIDLAEAKQQAEVANLAKSTFLSNMSHEIRTPMTGVLGMASLLRRTKLNQQQTEYLDKVESSGKHLLSIINDILDISKIEAGKLKLNEDDFKLADLIGGVVAIIDEKIRAKGLHFILDLEGAPQFLHGDRMRLGQCLINYLGNAVKFTDEGRITLVCRISEETEAGYLLRFEVRDTGIGLTPAQMGHIFEAFEQADKTTTREYGGTGLGLTITRRIALMMGGEVGVESEAGKGSTFWLTARLGKAAETYDPETVKTESAEQAITRDFHGSRILVVEDEPINQELARTILECVGLVVEVAGNGAEAIKACEANDYALVLMDMRMPVMDGIEATRAIRQLPSFSVTPILALTANAFNENRELCLSAGMNDFICKPFDPEILFLTLLKWLKTS